MFSVRGIFIRAAVIRLIKYCTFSRYFFRNFIVRFAVKKLRDGFTRDWHRYKYIYSKLKPFEWNGLVCLVRGWTDHAFVLLFCFNFLLSFRNHAKRIHRVPRSPECAAAAWLRILWRRFFRVFFRRLAFDSGGRRTTGSPPPHWRNFERRREYTDARVLRRPRRRYRIFVEYLRRGDIRKRLTSRYRFCTLCTLYIFSRN